MQLSFYGSGNVGGSGIKTDLSRWGILFSVSHSTAKLSQNELNIVDTFFESLELEN
jgi:hypothetical protein